MSWEAFTPNSYSEAPLPEPSCCPSKLYDGDTASFHPDLFALEYPTLALQLGQHRESVSSSSGSSLCEPCSPMGRRLSTTTMDTTVLATEVDADSSEGPWNLVADHVPWGPGYEGYERGTLPGPKGACVFLRSPTPVKRQRTTQACDKCRERKAKCSGSRPSCTRCLSRGVSCIYSASTVADAQLLPLRTSLRRSSHSGLSAPKPAHMKVPARARLRRRSSLMETVITMGADSIQEAKPEFKGTHYPSPFCDGLSMDLNGDVSGYSHSLLGDDFESPIEPPTTSPFVSFPSFDSAMYQPPGGMIRTRPIPVPQETSTLLYAHSLSALDEYRFPPVEEQKHISMPQLPLASPRFHPHIHIPPVIDNSSNSVLMADGPIPKGVEVLWQESGFNQDFRTITERSPSDTFNTAPECPSETSHVPYYSQRIFVQPGLGDPLAAHFQS